MIFHVPPDMISNTKKRPDHELCWTNPIAGVRYDRSALLFRNLLMRVSDRDGTVPDATGAPSVPLDFNLDILERPFFVRRV